MNPLTLVKRIQSINSKEADLGISEEASWHTKYKDSAYIFIGGIPFDLTEGDLLAVFAQYGEIVDVNLIRDKGTGKSKGFAFLAYEDQRSTILAVDNLNGAQILGRIVRVDHCSNYKKKEEEDEETERQKREARGVCRAFQRGECTRGAACKFSHDEQRAANTGWGAEDKSSRWGHDKFDGKKSERRFGNQEGFRSGDKDLSSRARSNERLLQSHPKESDGKRLRRHEDDEAEQQSREDHGGRQENRMKQYDEDFELKSRDNRERREEKRSTRYINDDESKLRDDSIRREERRKKQNDNDSDYRREERRFGRYNAGEYESRSGQDHYRREEKKLRRHGDDEFEPRSREEHERREGKGSRKHEPESSLRADRDGGARDGDSSSHRHGDRDDHRHRRAR